jgi:hypothetical protein
MAGRRSWAARPLLLRLLAAAALAAQLASIAAHPFMNVPISMAPRPPPGLAHLGLWPRVADAAALAEEQRLDQAGGAVVNEVFERRFTYAFANTSQRSEVRSSPCALRP